MAPMFGERERAAENIFVHDEELRFLAHRRGIEALSAWAVESMELSPEDGSRYTQHVVDAFVAGTPEDRLIASIQTDLERAGKPALSTNVGTILAQAVATATIALRGQREQAVSPQADPRTEWERRHRRPGRSWGWGL